MLCDFSCFVSANVPVTRGHVSAAKQDVNEPVSGGTVELWCVPHLRPVYFFSRGFVKFFI